MLVVSETTACWNIDCWSWCVMMCEEVYVSEGELVVQAQTPTQSTLFTIG